LRSFLRLSDGRRLRRFAVMPFALVAAACGSDAPTAPPGQLPLPVLRPGVWHLHRADGQAVPAYVAHRMLPGNVLEQTYVDSAKLEIRPDFGWRLETFLRHYENREFVRSEARFDAGRWAATDSGFLFTSTMRQDAFVVRAPGADSLLTTQALVVRPEAGLVQATYRIERPAPSLVARWRALSVNDRMVPAVVATTPLDEFQGRPVSSHVVVDSIAIELEPTSRYRMVEFLSWWIGEPNGTPTQRIQSLRHTDRGEWQASGGAVQFTSTLYANRGWVGQRGATGGSLTVPHPIGLDAGLVRTVVYGR
jgi:hypothetical protein